MLVDTVKWHEMLVGAVCVGLACWFIAHALQAGHERLDLRWRDVLTVWRVPGLMVHDAWIVTVVLFKDLLHRGGAASVYRVTGFHTAGHDPLLVARRVLATMYTTCTPNSIVIGIDPGQSVMLAHQLTLAPPSELEQELGRQG